MNFYILTLGCKVNSYESEYIKENFIEKGYNLVESIEEADIVIINTCSVTNQSDAKSRHLIRQSRRNAPNAIIVACGCSAQNYKEALLDMGANIVIGNKDKSRILEYVEEFKNKRVNMSKFYDMSNQEFESMYVKNEKDKTRAFVKIQDGCNNYCSYCIIPYMRGNIRSKNIDLAYSEINSLVESGHKEIVLTGIHTGSYGRGENYNLVDLIRLISTNPKLERIRISSIEITELGEDFLNELKNNPKICNHLHIPLQSGSDLVLEKMNRKYNTKFFKEKIDEIRSIRPDISITTDLIVGFAYESDQEFEKTYNFIKKIGFTKIHTFPFSLRSGTKAEEMSDHFIDEKTKKERVRRILSLSQELESNYYKKFIGKRLSVIVENSKNGVSLGHTDNYILVNLDRKIASGKKVDVIIDSLDSRSVKGRVVNVD